MSGITKIVVQLCQTGLLLIVMVPDSVRAAETLLETVQTLEQLGATIERNDKNDIWAVNLSRALDINAGLEQIKHLPHLHQIVLPPRTNDKGLACLSHVANLESLDLYKMVEISDEGLKHLTTLQHLKQITLPPHGLPLSKGTAQIERIVFGR